MIQGRDTYANGVGELAADGGSKNWRFVQKKKKGLLKMKASESWYLEGWSFILYLTRSRHYSEHRI